MSVSSKESTDQAVSAEDREFLRRILELRARAKPLDVIAKEQGKSSSPVKLSEILPNWGEGEDPGDLAADLMEMRRLRRGQDVQENRAK